MRKYKKVRPMFTKVVTTAEVYEEDQYSGPEKGLIVAFAGTVKAEQRVVAVGSNAGGLKVGDLVRINPARYYRGEYEDSNSIKEDMVQTMKHMARYDVPKLVIGGVEHFLIESSDVDYVIEEWEEEESSPIIIGSNVVL